MSMLIQVLRWRTGVFHVDTGPEEEDRGVSL